MLTLVYECCTANLPPIELSPEKCAICVRLCVVVLNNDNKLSNKSINWKILLYISTEWYNEDDLADLVYHSGRYAWCNARGQC
jgi:hypothetical protein